MEFTLIKDVFRFFIAFRARLTSKLENVLFYYFDLGKKFLSQNHGYQKSKIWGIFFNGFEFEISVRYSEF
jgi:hypothetical protein